jgi:hypothetical protein
MAFSSAVSACSAVKSLCLGEERFPLPPQGRLYAAPDVVNVPPREYTGSPPAGRSTLTTSGSAGSRPAIRWKGGECARRIQSGTAAATLRRLPWFAFEPGPAWRSLSPTEFPAGGPAGCPPPHGPGRKRLPTLEHSCMLRREILRRRRSFPASCRQRLPTLPSPLEFLRKSYCIANAIPAHGEWQCEHARLVGANIAY